MKLIEINQLTKTIKNKTVLSNINLTIKKGDVCGFLGPNGSGKTMLLRAISGLLYLPSGSITYSSPTTKGVVIENPAFLNDLTGLDNLRYLASIRNKITDQDIREAINSVLLDPDDQRKVKAYSLGMKQKLAIAQAIMESPELLVLDEPTRGLDAESVESIRTLLHSLNQRGTTILLASHNLEDISTLCTRTFQMENGKLVS